MDDTLSKVVAGLRTIDNRSDAFDILDALYLATLLTATRDSEFVPGHEPRSAPEEQSRTAEPPTPQPMEDRAQEEHPSGATSENPARQLAKNYDADLPYRGAYTELGRKPSNVFTVAGRGGTPLPCPLDFLRALRPLKQVKASHTRFVLDENATAEMSAIYHRLMPQMRPTSERWLRLDVVIDTSRSMAVWHAMLRQFKLLLIKSGIFDRVTFWSWDTQGKIDESVIGCDWPVRGRMDRKPKTLCMADNRQLVFVLSDAIADGWHDGRATAALEQWSRHALVALLPTLPSRYWKRTGLASADPALVLPAGSATSGYELYCVPRRRNQLRSQNRRHLTQKLTIEQWRNRRPVVAVSAVQPASLSRLTNFVARIGTEPIAGICLSRSSTNAKPMEPTDTTILEPAGEELLAAFDAHASPEARLLARNLSVLGYFSLEMIRLIRQTLIPQADLHDEAEILFSGISQILRDDPDPEKVVYGFLEPIRKRLAGEITLQRTYQLVQLVFGFWSKAAGITTNSLELLVRQSSNDGGFTSENNNPLATIAAETIQALLPVKPGAEIRTSADSEEVRKPRVHITYDAEIGDAIIKKELPAVLGVLADLSADSDKRRHITNRRFVSVHRDNFDSVFEAIEPWLFIEVNNLLSAKSETRGTRLKVSLQFKTFADFRPANVVRQVEPLLKFLTLRQELADLLSEVEKKPKLAHALTWLASHPGVLDPKDAATRKADVSMSSIPMELTIGRLISDVYQDTDKLYGLLKDAWDVLPPAVDQNVSDYLKTAIQSFDFRMSQQLSAVMKHPKFQRLESTWRGLHRLVHQTETSPMLKILVFDATKFELPELTEGFENSPLYRSMVRAHVDGSHDEPFTVLVGDFSFASSDDDATILRQIGEIAALSFTPFIAAANADYFGLADFSELSAPRDLQSLMETQSGTAFGALRRSETARFIVLTCPRVLARLPYGRNTSPIEEFDFEEAKVDARGELLPMENDEYCWMNSAWSLAECISNSFAETAFFKNIHGRLGGGFVSGLPTHVFKDADGDLRLMGPAEAPIPDRREKEICDLGVSAMCSYRDTDGAAFFSQTTLARAAKDSQSEGFVNLAAMLITCRFVHYLKAIVRDRLGTFMERDDIEKFLNNWIGSYVTPDSEASEHQKTRCPLRAAHIQLFSAPSQPGLLRAELHIRPWLLYAQLDEPVKVTFMLPN